MTTKNWDKGYDELLYMTNLLSLADRRLYLKLCSLYKMVHNLTYLPPNIVVPKVTRSYTSTPFTLYQPFNVFCTSCCIPLELTSMQSQLFQLLPCNFYTHTLYYLISRVQLILAMLLCTHAYAKLEKKSRA